MSDYHINIFYSDEDGGYVADIPDLESCSAFGRTPEEALAEVERAKEAWLEAAAGGAKRAGGPGARPPGRACPPPTAKHPPAFGLGARHPHRPTTRRWPQTS